MAQEQDKERASAFQQALDIRTAQGWTLGGKAVPVLYTDTINGEQVTRDDVWLCTTEALDAAAPQPPAALPGEQDAARRQHDADSRELSALCIARDGARRERDACKAEIAGLEASCATLGRLVDDLRPAHDRYQYLRDRDLNAISDGGVFAGRTPENVILNGDDLDAAIDAAMASKGQEGGAA